MPSCRLRGRRFGLLVAAVCAAVLSTGCSDAPPVDEAALEPIGQTADDIINGSPDTTHGAVVFLALANNGGCSGTIIHKQGSTGFVLTAAHCNNPQYVIQGNDYNSASAIVYTVTNTQAHPSYNNQVYDFRMVTFTGAGAGTPVIPAMSPAEDNLSSGTQIRHVGYGLAGPAPGSNNTLRRQILGNLSQTSSLTISYNEPNGGPCSGDSGGPQLTTSNERVAGVTSYGDPNCAQSGVSGRVSAVYNSFIMAYINNTPIGNMTCDQCFEASTTGQGACIGQVNACLNDSACNGLVQCINGCASGDQNCINNCANQYSSGISLYNAIPQCVCDSACMSECGGEPMCQPSSSGSTGSGLTTAGAGGSSGAGDPSGAGVGGAGVGAGGAPNGWSAGNETGRRKFDGSVVSSGCSAGGRSPRTDAVWWLLALALAVGTERRRRCG